MTQTDVEKFAEVLKELETGSLIDPRAHFATSFELVFAEVETHIAKLNAELLRRRKFQKIFARATKYIRSPTHDFPGTCVESRSETEK